MRTVLLLDRSILLPTITIEICREVDFHLVHYMPCCFYWKLSSCSALVIIFPWVVLVCFYSVWNFVSWIFFSVETFNCKKLKCTRFTFNSRFIHLFCRGKNWLFISFTEHQYCKSSLYDMDISLLRTVQLVPTRQWIKRAMSQLLQGLLWFAEKTIHQTTKQWTLAPKTIELRDTKVQWN